MGKAIELSPLAEVALRMYLESVSRLDYKPDYYQRRSLMEEAYREASEFMEVGDSFVVRADVDPQNRFLSEWEIDLVKRQASIRFRYMPRLGAILLTIKETFPDIHTILLDAGFSDTMDDLELPRLYDFLRGIRP